MSTNENTPEPSGVSFTLVNVWGNPLPIGPNHRVQVELGQEFYILAHNIDESNRQLDFITLAHVWHEGVARSNFLRLPRYPDPHRSSISPLRVFPQEGQQSTSSRPHHVARWLVCFNSPCRTGITLTVQFDFRWLCERQSTFVDLWLDVIPGNYFQSYMFNTYPTLEQQYQQEIERGR